MPIVSNDVCSAAMQPAIITEAMLCAGGEAGEDACQVLQILH